MENKGKYERYFSNFLSEWLPSSSEGMWITDIDFVLYNINSKKFCMIELKTRGNFMKEWQKQVYGEIHRRLLRTNRESDMKFVGTYCVEFEGDTFEDGRVWIHGSGQVKTEVYQHTLSEFIHGLLE